MYDMIKESIINLIKKCILPITMTVILFLLFTNMFTDVTGSTDWFYVWICCGLPFGWGKSSVSLPSFGDGLGESVAGFLIQFVCAGLTGGLILIKKNAEAIYNGAIIIFNLVKNK